MSIKQPKEEKSLKRIAKLNKGAENFRKAFKESLCVDTRPEQDLLSAFIDNLSFGVAIINRDGSYEFLNDKFKDIFGYTLDDIPNGKAWFEKAFPDSEVRRRAISAWIEDSERTLKSKCDPKVFRVRCKDGGERDIRFIINSLTSRKYLVTYEDVTRVIDAEKTRSQLRELEERYRNIVENNPYVLIELDQNRNIIYTNPAAYKILGYSQQEVNGRKLIDFIHHEDRKYTQKMIDSGMGGGKESFEARVITKNGAILYLFNTLSPLYREGRQVGLAVFSINITQRKNVEEELRENEERFRSIINEANDMIYMYDFNGKFLLANKAGREFTGYTRDDVDTTSLSDLFRGDDLKKVVEYTEMMRRGEPEPPPYEVEIFSKYGKGAVFEVRNRVIFDKGKPYGILNIARDVTERKKLEEFKRYQELFENVRDAILVSSEEGWIIEANDSACQMLEYDKHRLKNLKVTDLIRTDQINLWEEKLEAIKSEPKQTFENIFKTGSGRMIYVETDLRGITFMGRPAILSVSRDISDRKVIARELARRNRELESILYTASHDLKAPVITIQGFADLIEDRFGVNLEPRAFDFIDRIQKSSKHLLELIDDMVKIARAEREMINADLVQIGSITKSICSAMEPKFIEKGVTFEIADNFPSVYGDPHRMVQVFENLISNALRFLGENPEPRIEVGWKRDPDGPIFYVRDNGIGIDRQHYERIFDPFYRIRDLECEGTGIGLALVKLIIEQHGGRIWVKSALGKGTTFYFTLPGGLE